MSLHTRAARASKVLREAPLLPTRPLRHPNSTATIMAAVMPLAPRVPEPVQLETGWIVVKGGYLAQASMSIKSDAQLEGKSYTPVSKTNRKMAKFLDKKFKMVDWLVTARNNKVAELTNEVLRELAVAEDPLAGAVQGPAKRRRVTADELPQTVNLQVFTTAGNHHTVNVLVTQRTRDVLRMETRSENFELLFEEPTGPDGMPVVIAPAWKPVLMDEQFRWSRNAIIAKYCDGRKLRRRTLRVLIDEEWDNETKQCAVSEKEAELARWVVAHHVEY